jgi:hypothetical protein
MALKESMEYFISKYQEKYCYDLLEWCKEGRSIEAWAASINVIPDVLPIWMRDNPDFDVVVRVAYWKRLAYWQELALQDTRTPFKEKTLNPHIYSQSMRAFDLIESRDQIMNQLSNMSDEELYERARLILDTAKPGGHLTITIGENDDN